MTNFPTSKIELHQWMNTILLGIVGFFGVQTYLVITTDHEKLAVHETKITVCENTEQDIKNDVNFLTGRVNAISEYYKTKNNTR